MDERIRQHAWQHRGVISAGALGSAPARAAAVARLEVVQPRAFLASTQPVTGAVLVEAVRQSARTRYAFLSTAALWLLGAGPVPGRDEVLVAVPHSRRLRLEPPVRVSRVSRDVLAHVRTRGGCPVVDLEMAVLSACARSSLPSTVQLLEPLLRERRTTVVRLRARCRRGVGGSAIVRRACDELVGGSLDAAVRRLRRALEARGVAGLSCEVRFPSVDGASCYGDLWCEPAHTLVEVDGFLTHAVRERFRADRRRDRWMLRDHGVTTLRVDVAELSPGLEAVADELAELLLARSAALAERTPPVIKVHPARVPPRQDAP